MIKQLDDVRQTNKNFVFVYNMDDKHLKSEHLRKKYENLNRDYQATISSYFTFLKNNTKVKEGLANPNVTSFPDSSFVAIKGYIFNGDGTAGHSISTTLNECQADCAKNSNCTGASFRYNACLLKLGNGPIIPALEDDYAIVQKNKDYLTAIGDINTEMVATAREWSEYADGSTDPIDSYDDLISERRTITKLLREYDNAENTASEQQLKITASYYMYWILCIVAIVLLLIVVYLGATNLKPTQGTGMVGGWIWKRR